jgi:hypothetical protein
MRNETRNREGLIIGGKEDGQYATTPRKLPGTMGFQMLESSNMKKTRGIKSIADAD